MAQPSVKEVTVSYSLGLKVQVVKYEEMADFHVSETRRYDVTGMTDDEVAEFADGVRAEMAKRLNDDAVARANLATEERDY